MRKYLITWFDGSECKEAKIYAHDENEALKIAQQFIDDENLIISEF